MTATCDITSKRAVVNSAQAALDTAKADYMNCLPTTERPAAALASVADQDAAYTKEAGQLDFMSQFLVKQMAAETGTDPSLNSIRELAHDSKESLQKEIETLKAEISKERRIFLDSDAQRSPAVGGLYFTLVPDNKILIAFLSCLGAFLLFASLLLFLNHIPIQYFMAMTMGERLKLIGGALGGALVITYASFFAFT